jgi:hypothetical protein
METVSLSADTFSFFYVLKIHVTAIILPGQCVEYLKKTKSEISISSITEEETVHSGIIASVIQYGLRTE